MEGAIPLHSFNLVATVFSCIVEAWGLASLKIYVKSSMVVHPVMRLRLFYENPQIAGVVKKNL